MSLRVVALLIESLDETMAYCEYNLLGDLKFETPKHAMPRFLSHRNCEIIDVC